jgi:hypothetical protein
MNLKLVFYDKGKINYQLDARLLATVLDLIPVHVGFATLLPRSFLVCSAFGPST